MSGLSKTIFQAGVAAFSIGLAGNFSFASEVDVIDVVIAKSGNSERQYRFSVTLKHADSGWEHYADKWEVIGPDGEILGIRKLAHPHENEQPFTRSLRGVKISEDILEVTIRAHDSVHHYGGKEMVVRLTH